MRLISQDGMIDVPYENLTIVVDNDNDDGKVHILARGIVEYLSIIIAVYSNTDKALNVMEMLQKQFLDYCCNYHSQSGVFYFPKDEEVEV